MIKHCIGLALLLVIAQTISLTVSSERERCMVLSTTSDVHLMKVDLQFRKFEGQALEEGYRVVLHNTQTHTEQAYQVVSGNFRREFNLTENVVYRLCFKIVLSHHRRVSSVMQYHASDIIHQQFVPEIKVPDSLLKLQELQQSFSNVSILLSHIRGYNYTFHEDKIKQEAEYEVQTSKIEMLQWVSMFQIAAIVLFGGYQYFRLRGIIQRKATQ